MIKNYFFLLLIFLLSLNIISAVTNLDIPLPTSLGNSYGTYKQGNNVSLVQTCTNETAYCDQCNLTSLKYPDGSMIVANVGMTKNLALFNYTLDGSLTGVTGKYTVMGFCIGGGIYSPFAYNFEITPKGILSAGDVFTVFIWLVFIIALVGCISCFILTLTKLVLAQETIFGILTTWGFYVLMIMANYLGGFLLTSYIADIGGFLLDILVWSNGVLPLISLIITMFIKGMQKQKPLSVQEITGGGRFLNYG